MNRQKNPKPGPSLTVDLRVKKAKADVIAVRKELSTGPCKQRQRRKK